MLSFRVGLRRLRLLLLRLEPGKGHEQPVHAIDGAAASSGGAAPSGGAAAAGDSGVSAAAGVKLKAIRNKHNDGISLLQQWRWCRHGWVGGWRQNDCP